MLKEFQIKTDDIREKFVYEIKEELENHDLFIWGCGAYAKIIVGFLNSKGIDKMPTYILDDGYEIAGRTDTVSLSEFLKEAASKAVVVFGFYNYESILSKKEKYSEAIYKMYDFHFGVVNDKRTEWNKQTAKKREEEYKTSFELLSDEASKSIMQAYLDAATAGDFSSLYQYHTEPSYFNSITSNNNIDTLIDCGAFDGDSIHDFIMSHKDYKNIIAFEPDSENVKKIKEREKNENINNLLVVNAGVYSYAGKLYFNAKGESNSHLSAEGDVEVAVTTIDSYIDKISGKSLIKMDIEGSELEALKGAKETIKKYNPILTICVYHKEEDLIEIPQYINSLVDEGTYEYYLGFHGTDLAELVFYAIPKAK